MKVLLNLMTQPTHQSRDHGDLQGSQTGLQRSARAHRHLQLRQDTPGPREIRPEDL